MTHKGYITKRWRMRGALLAVIGIALAGASLRASAVVGPSLGAARSFAVLGASTVSNTDTATTVTGDLGVSPGSAVVGFPPGTVTGGTFVGGTPEADAAHSDASLAYDFLAGMASIPANNLSDVDLGGMTLAPAVYKFNSSAGLTGALTLDAGGDSSAVFVFQVGSSLTTATGASVTVINGGADYDESCVFWQVGSSATLGEGTAFVGNILAYADITIVSGSSLLGNALAINGAVTLDFNSVTSPTLIDPSLPTAPINLAAVQSGPAESPGADLSWNDASNDETEFRVYRRDGIGPDFVLIGTVLTTDMVGTGGTYEFQDPVLAFDTTYTYRVTASSISHGDSVPSNDALVDTGAVVPQILAPINLTAELNGSPASPGTDLAWTDVSDDETEFRVYRRDGAGPAFLLVGTVPTTNMVGTEYEVTFQDLLLDASTTYAYRVTSFNAADGESAPSNEALVGTDIAPAVRWLTLHLGNGPSLVRDQRKAKNDRVSLRGSYSVIDVDAGVPTVMHDMNPKLTGCTIQVRAPGNMILLNIAANDPSWKVSKKGVYRWKSPKGTKTGISTMLIDTRKSEFRFTSKKNDFGTIPVNAITVSLTCEGATGSEVRTWDKPSKLPGSSRAVFTLPK